MADLGSQLTEGFALQPFVEKAQKASGSDVEAIVTEALNHPLVFVFQELLDVPSVQALASSNSALFELLKIFAYGTFPTYTASASSLPALSPQQALKLRFLTLVSLSANTHSLPYKVLLEQLAINNVRELEDLVIDAIYQSVIQGRIDQRNEQIEIHNAIGRDVQPAEYDGLMATLLTWYKSCDETLKSMEENVGYAHSEHTMQITHKAEFTKQVEMTKADIKLQMERIEAASRGGSMMGMGGMGAMMGMMGMGGMMGDDRSHRGGAAGRR